MNTDTINLIVVISAFVVLRIVDAFFWVGYLLKTRSNEPKFDNHNPYNPKK